MTEIAPWVFSPPFVCHHATRLGQNPDHKEGAGSFATDRSQLSPHKPRGSEDQPATKTARQQWDSPTARKLKEVVFPFPQQGLDPVCQLKSIPLTFWEHTLAVLPFKRWKTNLSYQPAVLTFLNSVSALKFDVICWNILCYKTLHVVNFVTVFLEEIWMQANCISSSSSASHLKPVWTQTMEEGFSLSAKDFICIQCV